MAFFIETRKNRRMKEKYRRGKRKDRVEEE
jgi:hypothetical protein